MSLLWVNFQEVYERHLCRHSEFGLNVNHIIAVVGSYLGLFGVAGWLLTALFGDTLGNTDVDSRVLLLTLPLAYFVALAVNVPVRVLVACIAFTAVFFAIYFALPRWLLPWWLCVLLIPASHLFQQWGHKIFVREHDMTRYHEKYPKGRVLFVLLSLYELPILVNYLIFDGQKGLNINTPQAQG